MIRTLSKIAWRYTGGVTKPPLSSSTTEHPQCALLLSFTRRDRYASWGQLALARSRDLLSLARACLRKNMDVPRIRLVFQGSVWAVADSADNSNKRQRRRPPARALPADLEAAYKELRPPPLLPAPRAAAAQQQPQHALTIADVLHSDIGACIAAWMPSVGDVCRLRCTSKALRATVVEDAFRFLGLFLCFTSPLKFSDSPGLHKEQRNKNNQPTHTHTHKERKPRSSTNEKDTANITHEV